MNDITPQEQGKISLAIDIMMSYGVSMEDAILIIQLSQTAALEMMERKLVERLEQVDKEATKL